MAERLRDTRPRLLAGIDGRRERTLDSGHVITSAPGYTLFVQALWNGRWTAVPVDPKDIDAFSRALATEARRA